MGLLHMLLISFALNGLFFILAAILKTDVFTDITYSLSFVALAILLALQDAGKSIAGIVLPALVVIWGIRLGSYLFTRILKIKVDHRFDDKRDNPLKFGIFWILQAVTVWIVMLPVYGITRSPRSQDIHPAILAVSVLLFFSGLVIESVADAQKSRFKGNPANERDFISTGLWSWSRHPNYFGEILLWWALALPGVMVFTGLEWLYFAGPAYLTLLICFVSGIPLLERSALKKWGTNERYIRYRRTTSILIPRPPKKD